jgi:hypothetical protein
MWSWHLVLKQTFKWKSWNMRRPTSALICCICISLVRRKCVGVWEVVPKIPKCILTFKNLESCNFKTRFEGLKLVRIGIFIIPLERSWRVDIQNRVAIPIWILKMHLMTNWMVGSQISKFDFWPLNFLIDEPNHL